MDQPLSVPLLSRFITISQIFDLKSLYSHGSSPSLRFFDLKSLSVRSPEINKIHDSLVPTLLFSNLSLLHSTNIKITGDRGTKVERKNSISKTKRIPQNSNHEINFITNRKERRMLPSESTQKLFGTCRC